MLKTSESTILTILLVLQILLYMRVESCQASGPYFAQDYSLYGSTDHVSGDLSDLEMHDNACMTFRSYASQVSSQTLYAHNETVTVAGSSYYLSKPDLADASGMTLSVSMSSTGRKLWGKFVYPLAFVSSIPAGTWTVHYRAWHSSVSADNLTSSPSQIPTVVWSNAEYAYSSDNNYANISTPSQYQKYSGYGIDLPATALITKVEVGYEAYTEENERVRIRVSWDGGTKWSSVYVSPILGTVDPNSVSWADFTSVTSWNSTTLADGNFLTAVAVNNEGASSNVFLDWLPVRITFISTPPLAHSDVDLLIRKSDGSIRQTIAINVAESALLSAVVQANSASYSWTEYTVVDSTDYLEIDYFVDIVSANAEASAYLQVDDNTLVMADQTRVTGVILPSEHTIEVEFAGSSNTSPWFEMVLSICTAWTAPNVAVSIQLYNYTADTYATEGNGLITYVSSPGPDTEETENRTITESTSDFKDTDGTWKVRIKGVRNTISKFELKVDLVALATKLVVPDIALVSITSDRARVIPGELVKINVTVSNEGESSETFNVTIFCNDTTLARRTVFQLAPTTNLTIGADWETAGFQYGNYIIRASATVLDGEIDNSDNSIVGGTLRICKGPVAAFSFSPAYPVPNGTVVFNATGSYDSDGHMTSYLWVFGDGNTTVVDVAVVNHTYDETGTYNATLVVFDEDGFNGSQSCLLHVALHDVAVANVYLPQNEFHLGDMINVSIRVRNKGTVNETFHMSVYFNATLMGDDVVESLDPASERVLSLLLNISTMSSTGSFRVIVVAATIPGESETADNTLLGGMITILGSQEESVHAPQNWSWFLCAIPLILVPFGLFVWKRRKSNGRVRGFEFFNEITDGGIPDSFCVLLIGEAGSGKSVWCQELAYAFLKAGKSCLYVTYNNPPNEMRTNIGKFHPDVFSCEDKGKLTFVDCFSSATKTQSTEKYSLSQPFSLSDLGIVLTKATTEIGGGIRILFDSTGPLLAHVSPANVIDFLLDRTMRAKGSNSTFVLSVGKETIDANLANRLEENVDCIVELDVCLNRGKTVRRMHVRKMSGRTPSDGWIQFKIDRDKGITFLA